MLRKPAPLGALWRPAPHFDLLFPAEPWALPSWCGSPPYGAGPIWVPGAQKAARVRVGKPRVQERRRRKREEEKGEEDVKGEERGG